MLMIWYDISRHVFLLSSGRTFMQWDLGEFDQKGSVATRWGTKEELLKACNAAKQSNLNVIIDAVLNVRGYDTLHEFAHSLTRALR